MCVRRKRILKSTTQHDNKSSTSVTVLQLITTVLNCCYFPSFYLKLFLPPNHSSCNILILFVLFCSLLYFSFVNVSLETLPAILFFLYPHFPFLVLPSHNMTKMLCCSPHKVNIPENKSNSNLRSKNKP